MNKMKYRDKYARVTVEDRDYVRKNYNSKFDSAMDKWIVAGRPKENSWKFHLIFNNVEDTFWNRIKFYLRIK